MKSYSLRISAGLFLSLILMGSCTDDSVPLQPNAPDPDFDIQDGAHSRGNPHFFFLPPLVKQPKFKGKPDPTLSPVVTVCEWVTIGSSSACGAIIASFPFSTSNGRGAAVVRFKDDHYQVNWDTDQCLSGPCLLDPRKIYRLRVLIGVLELGHVDLIVVANRRRLKCTTTGEFIDLVDGRTLPVKFRIEKGAVTVVPPGAPAPIGAGGGNVASGDGNLALAVPPGALPQTTAITVTPTTSPASTGLLAGSVYDLGPNGTTFVTPVTLTIRYDPTRIPNGVDQHSLKLYQTLGAKWQLVAGSSANVVDHTVSGLVSHFSGAGAGEPVAFVTVIPASASVSEVGTVPMSATLEDVNHTVLTGRVVTWDTPSSNVLVDPSTGLVTAQSPGPATITATSEGVSGNADLSVFSLPVSTVAFSAVTVGNGISCGLRIDGTAWCWGVNGSNQLGTSTDEYCGVPCSTVPVAVSGGKTFTTIGISAEFGCGLATDRNVYCWGANYAGQLGDGSSSPRSAPAMPVDGGSFDALSVPANGFHACGLKSGVAYCWGLNNYGQLGNSSAELCSVVWFPGPPASCSTSPVEVQSAVLFDSISVGTTHTCGLTASHQAWCWGDNGDGQLGAGNAIPKTYSAVPVMVTTVPDLVQVSAGGGVTCGVAASTGIAYCWGSNRSGQLGVGLGITVETCRDSLDGEPSTDIECSTSPLTVYGGDQFSSISTGAGAHTCGVTTSTHGILCWGVGGLGNGVTGQFSPIPVSVVFSPPPDHTFSVVGSGGLHTCGLTTDDGIWCWGTAGAGQLGNGTRKKTLYPVKAAGQP